MLILAIPEDLDELFQNGRLAPIASLRVFGRIMIVTINTCIMFVIAIRRSEDGRAYRAGKMLNVVFSIQGSNVGAS